MNPAVIAAAVSFSGVDWLWPLAIAALVAVALVVTSYLRSPANGAVRTVCLILKLLGILALAVCLLEPMWSRSRPKPGANFFVVLADNSQGMQIKDGSAAKSRGDEMKELLARDSWLQPLGDTFTVAQYTFDSQLQRVDGFGELDFNGSASSLGHALKTIAERFRTQPLAGVLVLSDGNATDMDDTFVAADLPPVYPVAIGGDNVPRDISLQKVSVSQTAFEDAPVTLQAEAAGNGYNGEDVVIEVLDAAGTKVEERTQKAQSGKTLTARFSLKPPQRGVSFYTVRARAKGEPGAITNATAPQQEATLANNQRAVAINRGSKAHRILYVAGRPNWEFKFLNRALAEDEQLQLVALMRIAKREPKFEFIGRRGESSNPLFRGFGQSTEEAERYDQPVLVRLNTRDEFELRGGFPKTAEDLFTYDAIILDDLEAEFFTRDQMMLVQKFVSERGGGFLMLGGAESFREGNFARTPIGDMLPLYLDREREAIKPSVASKLVLTREGWLQPWMRLRDNEQAERARIETMPGFDVINPAHDVKPGASVLATISDEQSGVQPAFVAQRFGSGRTAALLIGDLWHWGLKDEAMQQDMAKAWRQMMRWVVTDVPSPVELRVDEKSAGGEVTLQVIARDKEFLPLDSATVHVLVTPAGASRNATSNSVRLLAEASASEPGHYITGYVPRETGGYRAEAVVLDANGAELGRAEAGWTSDPAAEEFRSLKPNRALLEKLAKQTGGEVISANGLERFVKSLPNRKAPVTETIAQPLWHTPAMFLFALACFAGEWGVRRWKGLP